MILKLSLVILAILNIHYNSVPLIGCSWACVPRRLPVPPRLWTGAPLSQHWWTRTRSGERGTSLEHLSVIRSKIVKRHLFKVDERQYFLNIYLHLVQCFSTASLDSTLHKRKFILSASFMQYSQSHDKSHDYRAMVTWYTTWLTWWWLCCPCLHCRSQHRGQGPRTQTPSPSWLWWREEHWPGRDHWSDPGN